MNTVCFPGSISDEGGQTENLCFVIWLIGAPIGVAICDWIYEVKLQRQYPDDVIFWAAVTNFIIYIYVASLLYRRK